MPRQEERANYKKKAPVLAKGYSTTVPGKTEFRKMINLFRPKTWRKSTDESAYNSMKADSNKTFGDIAMKDMGAYPNAVAGATSFFPKAGTLIASTVKGKERRNTTNENIDKTYENIGFRQGKSNKVAYDLGQEAAELGASLGTALPIASKLFQGGKAIGMFKTATKVPKRLGLTAFAGEMTIPSTASANAFEYKNSPQPATKQSATKQPVVKENKQQQIYYNLKGQAMVIGPQGNFISYK